MVAGEARSPNFAKDIKMPFKNKKQKAEYMAEYRKRMTEEQKRKASARVEDRKREIAEWLQDLKLSLACEECGESHPACLDFHHTDPSEKEVAISRIRLKGWSTKRIMKEIKKCRVLCANCHRKLHYVAG